MKQLMTVLANIWLRQGGNHRRRRSILLGCWSCSIAICLSVVTATPSQAHWADMAAAEIVVGDTQTQMTLTFPTGLVEFADRDGNGQLTAAEVDAQKTQLASYLGQQIRLSNGQQPGHLTVASVEQATVPVVGQTAPNTHSTLRLIYAWPQPVRALQIHYQLFLPGVSTASCLATILQGEQLRTVVFTPRQPTLALTPGLPSFTSGGLLLAMAGALVWGAMHSLSPGHGKILVAAYLIGSHATAGHALFLALTTALTHTIGVFALGLIALLATQYILPEQLYPWMSLLSGLLVAGIGMRLLLNRLPRQLRKFSPLSRFRPHAESAEHDHASALRPSLAAVSSDNPVSSDNHIAASRCPDNHHKPHTHDHYIHNHHHCRTQTHSHHIHSEIHTKNCHDSHEHHHIHHKDKHLAEHRIVIQASTELDNHSHSESEHFNHFHSHLPPGGDGSPITWRSLLILGISGGLVPCPAALVLLLSCLALGKVAWGLTLLLAFSLGLAGVLVGFGLTLVYAKRLFYRLPNSVQPMRFLPVLGAVLITVMGWGIATRALIQIASGAA